MQALSTCSSFYDIRGLELQATSQTIKVLLVRAAYHETREYNVPYKQSQCLLFVRPVSDQLIVRQSLQQ